ncbi:DUF4435 domain-containing protein [Brevundimonas nasdae]|uniref:DUF4435 domain-containing protein n=1 Tax=Brevundimonas nasdae TaxID=172043 RepID=A0ACD4VMC8_9CAUL|nr:DUF4435 domain-containing protein [Brevundimonas nasdae]
MPKYSARTARALSYLKRTVNDVDIYVEDTGSRNMWVRLLTQLLPAGVRLRSINMLGGRRAVEDACAADQANDGRRKLFIIDGDFDHLKGKAKPKLKFLYRLRAYCVENILLSQKSIRMLAMETHPNISENDADAKFDFQEFVYEIDQGLKQLFQLYAVSSKLSPSVATISHPVLDLCLRRANGELALDPVLIKKRMSSLLRAMLRHTTKDAIRKEIAECGARAASLQSIKFVSGKSYIFPILESWLRIRLGIRATAEQLKVRLAGHFQQNQEPYFARRVANL